MYICLTTNLRVERKINRPNLNGPIDQLNDLRSRIPPYLKVQDIRAFETTEGVTVNVD